MVRDFSNAPDKRLLVGLDRAERIALLVVVLVAGASLVLWFVPAAARLAPSVWSMMTANTAVGLLLAVLGLLSSARTYLRITPWLSGGAIAVLLILSLLTLYEYAFGVSLGIDPLLPHQMGLVYPGRPAPQTALGFLVVGLNLLFVRARQGKWSVVADGLALLLFGLIFVLLGGTIFDAQDVVSIHSSNRTAPQTLLCFMCLACVVARRRAVNGRLLSVLVNIGIGSRMMRIVLPGAVFVPFALFVLAGYMTRSSTISLSYAYAFAASAGSFFLLCLVIWMAWRINAMESRLRDLSLTDELTRVNNRRGFYLLAHQAWRDASRSGSGIAALYFDLDGLKEVNDTRGHDAGSEMICKFAAILSDNLRESDVIGRVGGDEFAVVTTGSAGNVTDMLMRVREKIAAFNEMAGPSASIRFSVGSASRGPGGADSLNALIARADEAMYQEKRRAFAAGSVPARSVKRADV